jgi:hypothetical protein
METTSIAAAKQFARRKRFLTLFLLVSLLVFGSALEVSAVNVKMAWDPSPEPLVTGYRVYYGTASGYYTNVVDAGNRTDATVTGLEAGTTYYFAATAYTGAGDESPFSNVTSNTTPGSAPSRAGSSEGGGCFIATAAFGSGLAPGVVSLREFRDRYLLTNGPGRAFVDWYYRVSPPVAAFIAQHESLKTAVRWGLAPIVCSIKYPPLLLVAFGIVGLILVWRRSRRQGCRQPTANSQQPTANSQQPTANSQQPTANSQQPTANRSLLSTLSFFL